MRTVISVARSEANSGKPHSHPNEDAYLQDDSRGIYFVFDGVSSSSSVSVGYLGQSLGEAASRVLVDALAQQWKHDPNAPAMTRLEASVRNANANLGVFNDNWINGKTVDYNTIDLAGAVGAGGILEGNMFTYFHIGDVEIAVHGRRGTRILTSSQTRAAEQYYHYLMNEKGVSRSDALVFIRSHLRNSPGARLPDGTVAGFGVLDGTSEALSFVSFDSVELGHGEIILIYSDGLASDAQQVLSGVQSVDSHSVSSLATLVDQLFDRGQFRPVNDDRTCIAITIRGFL